MQTVKSVSWVRMVLAFGAVLLVAGSGLSLAAGPAAYTPTGSTLSGPVSVTRGTTANYVLNVTFNDGSTFSFPPTTGATFTAARGSFSSTSDGLYTAPSTPGRDRVTGTYTKNGVTTQAGRIITIL